MTIADTRVRLTEVDYDPFAVSHIVRSFPTTEAQREVWIAAELGSEASLAYNESISLVMRGALDAAALQAALQALLERHEALRATFDSEGANMLIADRIEAAWEVIDLAGTEKATQERELTRLRGRAVETPFDLLNGPLVRTVLVRIAADTHELILTTHHIVCDGWSFGVLSRDLMRLYNLIRDGRAPNEMPPADSFGDYALAALAPEHLRAADADEQYWVGMFDRGQPVLDLPTDRPRGRQRAFASRRLDYRLPPTLIESARRLGAKQGVSLFATLFGIFAALIDRLGAEGGVVVGVPTAGQAASGMDNLIGHCINVLPILIPTQREQSVATLIKQTGSRVLDAYDHQSSTFGQILTKLNVPREANRLPLVSVLFNIDSPIPSEALSVDGLAVALRSNPRAYENFELFVNANQTDEGVVLECQYHTDLFDADTVQRWLALYQSAIELAIANPERAVAELFSATEDDRRKLRAFNATEHDYPRNQRIEGLFALQVARTPDAPALVFGRETLSYRELDARSNAVARALQERAVGPGTRVGMGCGRNAQMLVAMLGILKTGAAYVPLDPAYPSERLAFMTSDADLRCIVSDRSVAGFAGHGVDVLLVDDLGQSGAPVAALSDPMAPAYVIYTSGSTGKPKGVVVHHQAVVNFLTSMARQPGMTADDRLVAVTSTSFDIAVLELFLPLTVGARITIADRDTVLDGAALRDLIQRSEASVLQATPAGWRLLLDSGWVGGDTFTALVGGEALPADLARELSSRVGRVWNMYGPTETTVWSTCWQVPRALDGISIGRPITNTEILVLDEAMRPCPIGVAGEMFIGGDGVATGYWQRPDLTDARFVIHDGARIYRTGDRGRWRNDGTLEHLGRLDFQIKVRGYRIELGEIETALLQQPGIERAVVLAREDDPGDVRLVAYVVPAVGIAFDWEAVRAVLRKDLPEYMVPAHFMALPGIPLLPNGKINRASLPRPKVEQQTRTVSEVPATATEASVLQTMEEILNLRGLALDENFFSAGGHSMLAARLTARLNKTFELSLPLRTVFEHATARALSTVIESAKGNAKGNPSRAGISTAANQSDGPLTIMQDRIRFMEELHPGRVIYNTPSAHRLKGPFDRIAFVTAFNAMVARQPSLRTAIAKGADGPRQHVVDPVPVELPFEDLSGLDAATREATLMQRMQAIIDQPMDIHVAPLYRATLYRLAPEEHVFLFMPHHIIWDGWSFDLLYEEMSAHYSAALQGRSAALPPLQVSYVDYAAWHRDWLAGDECRAQLDYWRQRFAAIEAPRALPTDHQRRAGMTGEGRVEWVHLDKQLTERMRKLAMAHGATMNMLVMAIYAAQISQATASSSIVVGVPMRGRLVTEVEPLMGFFNNMLPTPLRVDADLSITAWLAIVKKELLEAFAHQDVPFERLATEVEITRHASRSGLYQTLFSFQDARERQRSWGPLEHSSVLVMQKGATEDFGLWLMEVPNGLEGGINYNADLFDAGTARLFRDRFLGLVRRAVDNPDQTVRQLLAGPGADAEAFAAWIDEHRAASVGAAAPAEVAAASRPVGSVAGSELSAAAQRLAAIWAGLLGIDGGDMHGDDNFFDLGGSSLLVMRAVAESREKLGLDVDPRRYVYETLSQLALASDSDAQVAGASAAIGAITRIWSRLLGIDADDIHIDDNFFDLGGSSILAMEAVAAMDKELGWPVDPRRMVYETVGQLAERPASDAAAAVVASSSVAPRETGSETAPAEGLVSRVFGRLGRR